MLFVRQDGKMQIRLRDREGSVVQIEIDDLPSSFRDRPPASGVAEVRRDGVFLGFAKWERIDGPRGGYEISGCELGKL